MAFSNVQATEAIRIDTSSPFTWTHVQSGAVPKAVIVAAVHGASSTDHITAITYGGVAMTRIVRQTDTATEQGAAELWFLGSGIPSGNQTVSATNGATTDDIHYVSITMSAAADTAVQSSLAATQNQNEANPTLTPTKGGNVCVGFIANFYGGGAPGTAGANTTLVHTHDLGAFSSFVGRETSLISSTDTSLNITQVADDEATVAMTIKESGAAPATLAAGGQTLALSFAAAVLVAGAVTLAAGRSVDVARVIGVGSVTLGEHGKIREMSRILEAVALIFTGLDDD